ncbi:ExbD/TolR family protein [Epibacterium sp. Ofav1-8]|uniref:ExbD/TolR family protein n=1 Tax=Epibacterium sp. Ofav1-8 TaxID=2917735 RepID=UPI001EF4666E|nr:biopolymer transporter ExbD [Epibacterium sp. Ofav1-8]MCG7625388.1 biopolymer transporter ExbD [Epibacterium sp. Ofav1-8]
MKLNRPARATSLISLVPMIDVLLILLVFFMVTSTYLNLNMLPVRNPAPKSGVSAGADPEVILIRLSAEGRVRIGNRYVEMGQLQEHLQDFTARPDTLRVLILPSAAASTQSLVSVLETVAQADVRQVQILRLEVQK